MFLQLAQVKDEFGPEWSQRVYPFSDQVSQP